MKVSDAYEFVQGELGFKNFLLWHGMNASIYTDDNDYIDSTVFKCKIHFFKTEVSV